MRLKITAQATTVGYARKACKLENLNYTLRLRMYVITIFVEINKFI